MSRRAAALIAALTLAGCGGAAPATIDQIAEDYVKLVLALGEHDADYVDAYYGPPEWREEAAGLGLSTSEVRERGQALRIALDRIGPSGDELDQLRFSYLEKQIGSMVARAEFLEGADMTFDEESLALYDAIAPTRPESYYEAILAQIDSLVPGAGPLAQRYDRFMSAYRIPPEALAPVIEAAVEGCKARTAQYLDLPPDEGMTLEYVQGRSWGGYNWYQGGYQSLMQINTDVPFTVGGAVDIGCHEGYPGHHVYNQLLELELVNGRGWPEFSVYPLFSPQSLIAEGTANFGVEMAFPDDERIAFERDVLFPLAGLDPATADAFDAVRTLVGQLDFARNEAARRYLDGEIDREAAGAWLARFAMTPPDDVARNLDFIEQYRSYVINYNLGRELVRGFVDGGGADQTQAQRWARFISLLASPRLPGDLIQP